jgi:HK97 family phage major capsid protein
MLRNHKDFLAYRAKFAALGVAAHLFEVREAPSMEQIGRTLDQLGTAVEAHRKATDEQLLELKKLGTVTPETRAKLDKLDDVLDQLAEQKKQLETLITRASRPGAGAGGRDERETQESREHRRALVDWMRDPQNPERRQALYTAQKELAKKQGQDGWETRSTQTVTSSGAAGGFALPEEIAREIARLSVDISPIRQIATVRTVGTPDYKELFDINGAAFEWLAEAATRNQTNTPDLAEVAPTFGMASAKPQASEESLDDLFFNVEEWLTMSAAEAIAKGEGTAFVSGDGTNKPTGFLAGTAPVSTTDASRAFGTLQYIASGQAAALPTSTDLFYDVVYALRARYRANARWVTSKLTLSTLRKYKDTTNQYLWQPSLVLGTPDSFMGYPVVEAEDMPAAGANTFPLAFGDFREGYLICDRVGMRITRDEITTPGFVKFYIRKRVGGKVRNTQAIKLLKCATS